MFRIFDKAKMISKESALPGRDQEIKTSSVHYVNGNTIKGPFPESIQEMMVGMGCFWGAERKFWTVNGVYSTAVGYSAGFTPNPTYEEVCSGLTGHNEVVKIWFDQKQVSIENLLKVFWESHNPTQGMRQGNDSGTQYRSGIYYFNDEQKNLFEQSKESYENKLKQNGLDNITTEIISADVFYYAEEYHQQYLAKNPNGYCGLGGTGIKC